MRIKTYDDAPPLVPDMPDYAEPISGIDGREAFQRGLCRCKGLSKAELNGCNMLATFFSVTDGQCNPGWTRLAKELGRDKAAVKRTMNAIEDHGIIKLQRTSGGDHDQKINFILFMPPASVTPTKRRTGDAYIAPVDDDETVMTGDASMSPVEEPGRGTFCTVTGDGFEGDGGPLCTEHKNREQVREQGPKADPVESQSERAYGAFCRAYRTPPTPGCEETFNKLLADGADFDDIMDHACDYAERVEGHTSRPMAEFLQHMKEIHR